MVFHFLAFFLPPWPLSWSLLQLSPPQLNILEPSPLLAQELSSVVIVLLPLFLESMQIFIFLWASLLSCTHITHCLPELFFLCLKSSSSQHHPNRTYNFPVHWAPFSFSFQIQGTFSIAINFVSFCTGWEGLRLGRKCMANVVRFDFTLDRVKQCKIVYLCIWIILYFS